MMTRRHFRVDPRPISDLPSSSQANRCLSFSRPHEAPCPPLKATTRLPVCPVALADRSRARRRHRGWTGAERVWRQGRGHRLADAAVHDVRGGREHAGQLPPEQHRGTPCWGRLVLSSQHESKGEDKTVPVDAGQTQEAAQSGNNTLQTAGPPGDETVKKGDFAAHEIDVREADDWRALTLPAAAEKRRAGTACVGEQADRH